MAYMTDPEQISELIDALASTHMPFIKIKTEVEQRIGALVCARVWGGWLVHCRRLIRATQPTRYDSRCFAASGSHIARTHALATIRTTIQRTERKGGRQPQPFHAFHHHHHHHCQVAGCSRRRSLTSSSRSRCIARRSSGRRGRTCCGGASAWPGERHALVGQLDGL